MPPWATLSKVARYCVLLRWVVEVSARHEVDVSTCAKVPPDSDGAGKALPTANFHDVHAIERVIVDGG